MRDLQFSLGWMWCFVFFTLSFFFVLAERRYRGRGFGLLAAMILAMGLSSAADAVIFASGAGATSLLFARLSLILGLAAGVLNTHFLCLYFDTDFQRIAVRLAYPLLGIAALGVGLATLFQWNELSELAFPDAYRSPGPGFSLYFFGVAFASMGFNTFILRAAVHKNKPPARAMLISLLVSAPVVAIEGHLMIHGSERWYLIEVSTWVYVLIVIACLITEFQGTAGLLRQTTSSLVERTLELEHSYAEIDLMASELSRQQQLAAVGELAAAIAHEVRNPLAIIMNAVSGMKRPTLPTKDRDTLLDIVNEEAERLNQLVAELLRFARPVTTARSPVSLYDICERASQAAPPGYQVHVRSHVDGDLGPVLVDPGLFLLVLDNLIANSCQAMPGGGSIEITVQESAFSDGSVAAAVEVRDHGTGMPPQVLAQAKKPFFTTKPRGTGLGIPIAEKIVDAHGGEMVLVSTKGEGTIVRILLPLEKALKRAGSYSEGIKASNRRRLRSIPPLDTAASDVATAANEVFVLPKDVEP